MDLKIQKKGLTFNIGWLEGYLWGVTLCMILFGLWGLYDGLEIGCARAGWKFILMFLIFVSPALATLIFFKPKTKE